MSNYKKKALAILLLIIISNLSYGALKGTYTINPSVAASKTNYKTFTSALSDLTSGTRADGGTPNGMGVSGAVIFNAVAGTFNEGLSFKAIKGVSASYTISFIGAGRNVTTISGTATNGTLEFDAARYLVFKNMTIGPLNKTPVYFNYASSITSRFITFRNCRIGKPLNSNMYAVDFKGSSKPGAKDIRFDSCVFFAFQRGLNASMLNPSDSLARISCTNDSFSGFARDAIYMRGRAGLIIRNCYFNNNTINALNVNNIDGKKDTFEISGNRFYNTGETAIGIYGGNNGRIFNNIIGGGFSSQKARGIYFNSGVNFFIYNNSVFMDANGQEGESAALYLYNGVYVSKSVYIYNNHLIAGAVKGYAQAFYMSDTMGIAMFNCNNFYNFSRETPRLLTFGLPYTKNTFRNIARHNQNSFSENPEFISGLDLTPQKANLKGGSGVYNVTYDINKIARPSIPSIGAIEPSTFSKNDVGVELITSPVSISIAGSYNISFKIRNYGTDTLKTAVLGYKVNSGAFVSIGWTGSLLPGNTTSYTFSSVAFGSGYDTLSVFASSPNSSKDFDTNNDTLKILLATPLNGTYYINNTGKGMSDFTSFQEAIMRLNTGGVSGNVNFEVISSQYPEPALQILPYNGMNSAYGVKFQSLARDSSKVTILNNSSAPYLSHSSENIFIKIAGANYITIKNIGFKDSLLYQATFLYINNLAKSINISGNNFFLGKQGTSSHVSMGAPGDSINIFNNYFYGGTNGIISIYIYFVNNHLTFNANNNIFKNITTYPVYLRGGYSTTISNNIIDTDSSFDFATGILAEGSIANSTANIISNKIHFGNSATGISAYGYTTTSKKNMVNISNNFISIDTSSYNTLTGIWVEACGNPIIYHNSIRLSMANTYGRGRGLIVRNNSLIANVKNNIIVYYGKNAYDFALMEIDSANV